ncbi:polyphosphate kinase 1 [Fulvivirga sp. M361]|uniref:polyphosphate kinase 1 n=1 Tax=Fulvivirga sp. M361 TaxID=2594266 RepID=UPI001623B900|nr:polyphosphate kinase 1 [Fulvivirga sp. M361]
MVKYFDRDLSWLSFNKRVLMEATNPDVPLYERIKFLAIYSSNLDEFFRVRVAGLRSIVDIDKKKINKKFNKPPKEILSELLEEVYQQQEEFGRIKRDEIIPQLKKEGIHFYRGEKIIAEHQEFAQHYFKSKILSYLQPVLLTSSHSRPIHLENRQLYFIVCLRNGTGDIDYALLNIPSNNLSRFIALPKIGDTYYIAAIDDIMRENLDFLFPQYQIEGCYSIKLNRDADLNIEDEYSGNLVKKIKKQIEKRDLGVPSRFLYDSAMPLPVLEYITEKFQLTSNDLLAGGRYHNMYDLFQLSNPLKPRLENPGLPAIRKKKLDDSRLIFHAIDEQDILLHFPYQSYDYVLRFFNEAALDPQVKEIKATFYRIASDSFICNALISAANNGKKVTVFVEIKARFDEENNLKWAEKMKKAGIEILYSIPGLKVHAKVALVIRHSDDGAIRKYGYLGTGNFNEKTAVIYADEALLTHQDYITNELDKLFSYLVDQSQEVSFQELLVSQFNITDRFKQMVDQEIEHALQGRSGHIIIKLNNLQDDIMIDKLYEASQAGVKVELIVRAICCLRPGVKGLSETITVHRIVDRYLEHSRVFYFYNNGREDLYLGSADWMKRNLYHRIEVVFPLHNPELKKEVIKLVQIQLADNVKGCELDRDLNNIKVENGAEDIRSQHAFYQWLADLD